MAVKVKQFVIDEDTYEITQLGAKKGRVLWLELVKAAAEPMKELGAMAKVNDVAVVTALAVAVKALNPAILEQMYEAFGESCTVSIVDDKTGGIRTPKLTGVVFDQHFAGNYVALTKWLWECTSFNFLDFLGDLSLGTLVGRGRALAAETTSKRGITSNPQTATTGSSGES